uniref:Cytochrome c oxidase subunit 2 n=1 Tax=Rhizophydium sp. 136 TaxID=60187 RepID=Q950P4_9FUNG|nr:cytochrome c oxidase subunit 2 [Rhizophydium sp. 136]AAK84264.1 cytochrome c oxidase subunit 2 [Rhizophydium sp. 136]
MFSVNFNFACLLFSDYPINYSYSFQDPASDWLLGIINLHDNIIFYLIIILTVVLWLLTSALLNPDHLFNLHHGNLIELIWTITPAAILWMIGLPSLKLLYLMDEILSPEITVKAIGNQWYWSFEYGDHVFDNENGEPKETIAFDSFMVAEDDLELGEQRNLAVDNYLVLPINTSIRMLVTANDVIHSFSINSLGIKVDALPGRINALGFIINRPGQFYGQCSELCGSLHGFMPIGLKAVSLSSYLSFINSFQE